MKAQHSAVSMEHGTPAAPVELARYALGSIDLDPASSAYWNAYTVQASRFFDRFTDGLRQRWAGNVWLNPPGADDKAGTDSLVREFWDKLVESWRADHLTGAVYYGYSLEQLQTLQSSAWSPGQCVLVVFSSRQRHLQRGPHNGPPVPGTSPTHANFAALLPTRCSGTLARAQVARFVERGRTLGVVTRPV